jgi:hypothetical protein
VTIYRHVNGVRTSYSAFQSFTINGYGSVRMFKYSENQFMFDCNNVITA